MAPVTHAAIKSVTERSLLKSCKWVVVAVGVLVARGWGSWKILYCLLILWFPVYLLPASVYNKESVTE